MAPRRGTASDRESVAERRERVMELHRLGRYAWQIGFELGMSVRTVQRHLAAARAGRPVGKPRIAEATARRLPTVAAGLEQGKMLKTIAEELGVTPRAVRHYRDCLARTR